MTFVSLVGVVTQRHAREGNAIGALIFGVASFFLLKAARLIRVESVQPNTSSRTSARLWGMLAVVASLSVFVIVISGQWVKHELPSTGLVLPIAFVGMSVVGAACGFLVSGAANFALRWTSPVSRLVLMVVIWLVFCALLGALLLHFGDQKRFFALAGIASFWGLLVGPYNAELFVTAWFVKRRLNLITG